MGTISQQIELQGESSYRASLQNIVQKNKELAAEMKAVTSGAASEEARMKVLNAQIENQNKYIAQLNQKYSQQQSKVAATKKAIEDAAKEYGENSSEVQKLKEQLTKEETALSKTKTSINNATAALNQMEAQTRETGSGVQNMSNEVEESGNRFEGLGSKLKAVAAVGAAAVAAIGTAAAALGKKLVTSAVDVAEYGDEIDKESQKLGMSAENYQKLSYAMEMSGADIESMKKGMVNINKSLADFADGNEAAASSFEAMGVSLQKTDGSMKNSEEVLLDTIDALGNMEDTTKRDAMAQELFGKSFTELRPLLNEGSEGIRELMNEAEAYGMVMSDKAVKASADFDDSLTRAQGTMQGLKNQMIGELLPAFTEVVNGFSLLVSGQDTTGEALAQGIVHSLDAINQMLPKFMEIGGTIIKGIVEGISKNLPQILTGALNMLNTFMDAIIDNLPTVMSAIGQALPKIMETLVKLIEGIAQNIGMIINPILEAIPDIIEVLVGALPTIITAILGALPDIIRTFIHMIPQIVSVILEALPDIILALIEALPQIVLAIIEELPTMFVEIAKAVITNFPKIVVAVAQGLWSVLVQIGTWFSELFGKIGEWLGNILSDIWEFIKSIPKKIGEGFQGIFDAGKNLIKGLWEGISDAVKWVLDKIKGLGKKILDGIKGIFGIKSPSKEMAWIGQMLDEGLANGLDKYSGLAISEAFNVADGITGAMSGLATPSIAVGGIGGSGGVSNNAITMNIYGADGQNINDLADVVIDKLQRTIIGSEAVYA